MQKYNSGIAMHCKKKHKSQDRKEMNWWSTQEGGSFLPSYVRFTLWIYFEVPMGKVTPQKMSQMHLFFPQMQIPSCSHDSVSPSLPDLLLTKRSPLSLFSYTPPLHTCELGVGVTCASGAEQSIGDRKVWQNYLKTGKRKWELFKYCY